MASFTSATTSCLKAGYLSLFGYTKDKEQDLLQAEEPFLEFHKYDRLFPRFVYPLPAPGG